jgi:hypothetical protein
LGYFLADAPSATFLTLLVGDLVAKTAMIEKLFSREIALNSPGFIKSNNYDPAVPDGQRDGFIVKSNGEAEFNDLKLRGILDANLSFFNNYKSPLLGAVRGRCLLNNLAGAEWISVSRINNTRFKVELPNIPTPNGSLTQRINFVQNSLVFARASMKIQDVNATHTVWCYTDVFYTNDHYEVMFTPNLDVSMFPNAQANEGIIILIY